MAAYALRQRLRFFRNEMKLELPDMVLGSFPR
jgi:hypothetical protein